MCNIPMLTKTHQPSVCSIYDNILNNMWLYFISRKKNYVLLLKIKFFVFVCLFVYRNSLSQNHILFLLSFPFWYRVSIRCPGWLLTQLLATRTLNVECSYEKIKLKWFTVIYSLLKEKKKTQTPPYIFSQIWFILMKNDPNRNEILIIDIFSKIKSKLNQENGGSLCKHNDSMPLIQSSAAKLT